MPPDGSSERPQRLFFALWPPRRVQAELHRLAVDTARRCGGRATARDNIHLTLAFLGDVPPARLPELLALAEGVRRPAFSPSLDRLGWWRHNRIAWAGSRQPAPELAGLADDLAGRLAAAGWPTGRKPGQAFVPHLTLVRQADAAPARDMPPLAWRCQEFALVRSRLSAGGPAYETLAAWRLIADGSSPAATASSGTVK